MIFRPIRTGSLPTGRACVTEDVDLEQIPYSGRFITQDQGGRAKHGTECEQGHGDGLIKCCQDHEHLRCSGATM